MMHCDRSACQFPFASQLQLTFMPSSGFEIGNEGFETHFQTSASTLIGILHIANLKAV
jgi:hypothetical protein